MTTPPPADAPKCLHGFTVGDCVNCRTVSAPVADGGIEARKGCGLPLLCHCPQHFNAYPEVWHGIGESVVERGADLGLQLDNVRGSRLGRAALVAAEPFLLASAHQREAELRKMNLEQCDQMLRDRTDKLAAEARVAELTRELTALRKSHNEVYRDYTHADMTATAFELKLTAAEAERDRLRKALRVFGDHDDACRVILKANGDCDCGYGALLTREETPS